MASFEVCRRDLSPRLELGNLNLETRPREFLFPHNAVCNAN